MQEQIGRLMLQANFGRARLSPPALLLAHHYRLVVAALMTGLIASHMLILFQPFVVIAAVTYAVYVGVRLRIRGQAEKRFYTERVQFWRAQTGIFGVTLLLLGLAVQGNVGTLWILYLPALLLVSRYCAKGRVYLLVALEVAFLAATTHFAELYFSGSSMSPLHLVGELSVRVFAVLLPSFLIHYLARVDITAKEGAAVRDNVVRWLLEQALFEAQGDKLWRAIGEACAIAVRAAKTEVYLVDAKTNRLHVLEPNGQVSAAPIADGHPALQAADERRIVEAKDEHAVYSFAAPVFGQPDCAGPAQAVVVLQLRAKTASERRAALVYLNDLLNHIWPICAYASLREQFPQSYMLGNHAMYRLDLNEVLDAVLQTLCNKLGFSFATVSLVDEDTQEIRTVKGQNVPAGWVADARHPLDSHDIQADVLRTGNVEVISGWDPRFDPEIWRRYNHENLVRIWQPLGRSGTIEAGFYMYEKREVPRLLVELVNWYARDVTVAIQNALQYEREQRHAALLARLHEVSYQLQTEPRQHDQKALLEEIARSAHELLDASIVLLYPCERRTGRFIAPISHGDIVGRAQLAEPNDYDNIVRHIADTHEAYFRPDVSDDWRLVGKEGAAHGHRTFTVRQKITSFAGVPLLARGRLLGVLCVNYRQRHQFSAHDRRAIELFAQQAAAVIAGGELVREQERRRLEYDLHDAVKSSVRGLILFSRAATDVLESDPCRARQHLHEMRRTAWGILADVDIMLKDLTPEGYGGKALEAFIREEMRRLVGRNNSKLVLELDDQMPALPMLLMRTLLGLLRESVLNALEHAQAETIRVSIKSVGECVRLVIADDGRGFQTDQISSAESRGLQLMHERVAAIGGKLRIHSSPDAGTTVWCDLPQKEASYATG